MIKSGIYRGFIRKTCIFAANNKKKKEKQKYEDYTT